MADQMSTFDISNVALGFDSPFSISGLVGLTKPISAIMANWLNEPEPNTVNANIGAIKALVK